MHNTLTNPAPHLVTKARELYTQHATLENSPLKWEDISEETRIHWLIYAKGHGTSETRTLRRP